MDARGKRGNFAILYLTLISVCREREKSFFGGKETRVIFSYDRSFGFVVEEVCNYEKQACLIAPLLKVNELFF